MSEPNVVTALNHQPWVAVVKKIVRIIFIGVMFLIGLLFISPVVFVFLNAFKPNDLITLNPMALPPGLNWDGMAKAFGAATSGADQAAWRTFFDTINLGNFFNAWVRTDFPKVLLNTFIITLFSVVGIVVVSSMAAYALVRSEAKKTAWLFFTLFTLAMIIPFQVIMVPLSIQAADWNLSNIWGIIPMYWGLGCPLAIFMYHGFIKGVPLSLEESARIDGAGPFRVFFQIVLPLLTPITMTIVILDVLWIWNDFLLPLIIVREGTIQLAQVQFFGAFFKDYGSAMASLILSATPVLVLYFALQRYIIRGIAAGAVKG